MPIYARTYRSYDGAVRTLWRWRVVVKQELRVVLRTRAFLVLLVLGYLHVCVRLLQIVTYDTLNTVPNNPLVQALRQVEMMEVSPHTFYQFLVMQSSLVFLAMILAGAGMICDDFKNNLMEIYFSKPLTWRDYVLGKAMTLILIGLCFLFVPGVLMVFMHNILAPSMETLKATWWLPHAILLFSLALVLPCALGVLASSAMSRSERYSSIGIIMLLLGDLMIGRALPELLHNRNFAITAFPLAINRVGEVLFEEKRPFFELSWQWSALFISIVSVVALIIVCRKVRRAEIAA